MPLDVVGQHANEDVCADAIGEMVMDGAQLEVDGLEAAEGPLYMSQALVGEDGVCRTVETLG